MNNNELKYIQSFAHKKHWTQESVFIVEGPKLLKELLASEWTIQKIFATPDWLQDHSHVGLKVEEVDEILLGRMSQLAAPNKVLALVQKKQYTSPLVLENKFTLVLDGIQDPGNFGTIIRTADWFGVDQIIVSEDTAQLYNPKVIQSTMGSFLRVRVETANLLALLSTTLLPVFGALLHGKSMLETKNKLEGLLVIGNESKGIRPELISLIKHPLTIPQFGHAESLNAAVATGVLLAHFRS